MKPMKLKLCQHKEHGLRLIAKEKSTQLILGSVLIVNEEESKILRVNESLEKLDLSTYNSVRTFHSLENQDASPCDGKWRGGKRPC